MTRKERLGWTVLVAALAAVPFLPALSAGFLQWDDAALLLDQDRWRGLSLRSLRWMFTTTLSGPYQPLTWLSYALDDALWGLSPRAFHATNLALHAASAGLLFLIVDDLLGRAAPPRSPRERAAAAAFGALAWAVHPLRVESVAWVTERRDVLCALFSLAAVLLHLRRRPLAAAAAFLLALLAKGSAVVLPLVFLVLDAWPLRRFPAEARRAIAEKAPLVLLSAALGVVGLRGQESHAFFRGWDAAGPGLRAALAVRGLAFYAEKTLWPSGLSPFYRVPAGFGPASPAVVLSALAVAAACAAAWRLRRRAPWLGAAAAQYALSLAPLLGLVRFGDQLAADRYSLMAAAGPSALGAGAWPALRRRAPRAAAAAGLAVLAALAAGAARRTRAWRDDLSLWDGAVAVDPDSTIARVNRAAALRRAGRAADALADDAAAARLDPSLAGPQNNLAAAALARGDAAEALTRARAAAAAGGSFAETHYNLGLALLASGDAAAALPELDRAVALAPRWAPAVYSRGNALSALGREEEAGRAFDHAVRLDPGLEEAWVNGGNSWARRGRYAEAARRWRRALQLAPEDEAPREGLRQVARITGGAVN